MNSKSTQIVLIVGILAVLGGAVYASFTLVNKKSGSDTNDSTSGNNAKATNKSVLLNYEGTFENDGVSFDRPFFVPNVSSFTAKITSIAAEITLTKPDGTIITTDNAANESTTYSYDQERNRATITVNRPTKGIWQIQVLSRAEDQPYLVIIEATTVEAVKLTPTKSVYAAGEDVIINATATDSGRPVTDVRWDIIYGRYIGGTPLIVAPLIVFDDGNHADGAANDGVFGGSIPAATLRGKYHVEGDATFPSGLTLNTVVFFETPAQ